MARLIDADELKKNYQDELCKGIACSECSMQIEGFCRVEWWIDIAPTVNAVPIEDYRSMEQTVYKLTKAIADAEPIVRCKDCKYLFSENCPLRTWIIHVKTDYCSYGVQKDEVPECETCQNRKTCKDAPISSRYHCLGYKSDEVEK